MFNDFKVSHEQSDVDNEPSSQHHTLGRGPNQAAAGNHGHETASPDNKPPDRPARGDVWVVSDMDNLRRRWDGANWNDEVLGDQALGAITADSVSAGAIDGEYIYGATLDAGTINASEIYGSLIDGADINADAFRTGTDHYSQVEMGALGGAADEVRFWSNYYSCSIRNPSDIPGTLRFNINNMSYLNMLTTSDGWPAIRRANGGPMLKFVGTDLQAYLGDNTGYTTLSAIINNVSASKFKDNLLPQKVDIKGILNSNSLTKWRWKNPPKDDDGNVVEERAEDWGLIADDMPDWMQAGEGYSVGAVLGFLWEALKDATARIEALEARGKPNGT